MYLHGVPRLRSTERLRTPGQMAGRLIGYRMADGTGPLYREAARDDLNAMAGRAADALAW